MRLLACLLTVGVLSLTLGCSVVKEDTATRDKTYDKLRMWKVEAAKRTQLKAYEATQKDVNGWLDAKAIELQLAGTQLLSQVEITPPEQLTTKVEDFLSAPAIAGWEDILVAIFQIFLDDYKESRIKEASEVSTQLNEFKWPDAKPATPAPTE